jgi:hypothetical protein
VFFAVFFAARRKSVTSELRLTDAREFEVVGSYFFSGVGGGGGGGAPAPVFVGGSVAGAAFALPGGVGVTSMRGLWFLRSSISRLNVSSDLKTKS